MLIVESVEKKKLRPNGKVKSVPNDLTSHDQANQFTKHFVSIASSRSIVDNNHPATPDLSHIESFVNDTKTSIANFQIPLLDVGSLDNLINVATGLHGIIAPLLKHISPAKF